MLAFLSVDGVSIVFGGTFLTLVPLQVVQIVSGVAFVVFGVVQLLRREKEKVPETKPGQNTISRNVRVGCTYGTWRQT